MPTNEEPASGLRSKSAPHSQWAGIIALTGFVLVATAQVTNMILARRLAGTVPPFTLAFFRWAIIAVGLAPLAIAEFRHGRLPLHADALPILAAGFLGMFVCGGPVYVAGMTTSAINIALIMSLSPIVVLLLSRVFGLERIGALQVLGMGLALIGALLIVSQGDLRVLVGLRAATGDLLMLMAMLGWSGYTLLQSRVAKQLPKINMLHLMVWASLVPPIPALAISFVLDGPSALLPAIAGASWLGLMAPLYLGLFASVFAYAVWGHLLQKYSTGAVAPFALLAPAVGAIASSFVFGESFGPIRLAGMACMVVGLAIVVLPRQSVAFVFTRFGFR